MDTHYATMMSMTEFGYAQSPDLLKAWKPVSYTHLDVYKRQVGYRTQFIVLDGIKQNINLGEILLEDDAVAMEEMCIRDRLPMWYTTPLMK